MDDYVAANRELWDKLTPVHVASDFYGVHRFRAGQCTLLKLERDEVGDVAGQRLLHLQCHFGLDTLSWARRGAIVTGVDFSPKAIAAAQALAADTSIPGRFVHSNVYDLPENLTGKFDIVFTSGGVLCWLPDLRGWARVIAHFLQPGGILYLREFHPVVGIFDDRPDARTPCIHYPYFHSEQPLRFEEEQGSYADPAAKIRTVSHEWSHSLADVVNALIEAGLQLEFLHEFPFTSHNSHPFLVAGDDGLWRYPDAPQSLPLMFSVRARAGSPRA